MADTVQAMVKGFTNGNQVIIFNDVSELPHAMRAGFEAEREGGKYLAHGVYRPNTKISYLYRPDIIARAQDQGISVEYATERTLLHETGTHYGSDLLFGTPEQRVAHLNRVYNARAKEIGDVGENRAARADAVEEWLAPRIEAATTPEGWKRLTNADKGLLRPIWQGVRRALRKAGLVRGYNDFEINALAHSLYQGVAKGRDAAVKGYEAAFGKMDAPTATKTAGESPEIGVRFSVASPEKQETLESEKKFKAFRAMQLIDGKLYPPMSAKVDGQLREPTHIGVWEQADESPELARDGMFKLDKANKSDVKARYNPYFHVSRSPLNDQFSSASRRPNLVTVEVEIPASELTSGYRAEGAKDAVGEMSWRTGPVSRTLPEHKTRKVILSRYAKVVRIVPDSEVADHVAKLLEGENISIPENVITPSLKQELIKRSVNITSVGVKDGVRFSSTRRENSGEGSEPHIQRQRKRFQLFVDRIFSDKQHQGELAYRTTNTKEIEEILRQGGPDTTGMVHAFSADWLRHAVNEHSNAEREAKYDPPQRPLTKRDIERIPEVLDAWDSIRLNKSTKANRTSVIYSKRFSDGEVVYIERAIETTSNEKKAPRLVTATAWAVTLTGVESSPPPVYTPEPDTGSIPPPPPDGNPDGARFSSTLRRTSQEDVAYTPGERDAKQERSVIVKAVRHFGFTTDHREAGYVMPDGRMLDLSGKRQGGSGGVRYMDHRELPDLGGEDGTADMLAAKNAGLARVDFNLGLLNITRQLTEKQRSAIESGLSNGSPDFITVEVDDPKIHRTVYSADMDGKNTGALRRAINEAHAVVRGERAPERVRFSSTRRDGDRPLAPNGKPSNLSRGQHAQVRTEAFKKWAGGDWEIASRNAHINSLIEQWGSGALPSNTILDAGRPSETLLRHGVPDLPITMRQQILRKAVEKKHGVSLDDLKDITLALHAPIAIFDDPDFPGTRILVTDIRHRDGNITVAVRLNVSRDALEVNDIRSIHPKKDENAYKWFEKGLLLGLEKEKGRKWLENSAPTNPGQPQATATFDNSIVYENTDFRKTAVLLDENGEPKVVYHGTDQDFTVFDGKRWRFSPTDGIGSFFSDDPAVASSHAVFGSDATGANVKPVYLSMRNPFIVNGTHGAPPIVIWESGKARNIMEAKKGGHDGIIVDNGQERMYIPFAPTQIKSAVGNRGTFDPTNADIRYSSTRPRLQQRDQRDMGNEQATRDAYANVKQANPVEHQYDEDLHAAAATLDPKDILSRTGILAPEEQIALYDALDSTRDTDPGLFARFAVRLQKAGTDAARALGIRARLAGTKSAGEAFKNFLNNELAEPTKAIKKRLEAIDKQLGQNVSAGEKKRLEAIKKKLIDQHAKNIEKTQKRMKDMGLDLKTVLDGLDKLTPEQRTIQHPAVQKAIASIRFMQTDRASFGDALYEYWIASLLSGIKTNVVNVSSNTLHGFYDLLMKRPVEAMVNTVLRKEGAAQATHCAMSGHSPIIKLFLV